MTLQSMWVFHTKILRKHTCTSQLKDSTIKIFASKYYFEINIDEDFSFTLGKSILKHFKNWTVFLGAKRPTTYCNIASKNL